MSSLNPAQQQAVETTEGPLLIVAGAGAGKTKTLTHRIRNIIKKGVSPSSILAITFTNKAAKEMRERVHALLSEDRDLNLPVSNTERPFVSTFHALGVHILKEQSELLGLPRHFSIFDKDDAKRTLKACIIEANLDPKQYEPGKIGGIISREKGNFVTCDQYEADAGDDYTKRITARIWRLYEDALQKEKALDFDDLLLKTALLLKRNITVAQHYQNVWKYVHIDEYQDTNHVQYQIAKIISAGHRNICAVGDIDQNIYSWRGAQIRNIIDFEKDYPEAKVLLLEQNYRSTKTILEVANAVIAKNKMRRDKNLFTENSQGEKVGIYEAYDESDEAMFVAQRVKKLQEKGVDPKEIAVLFRANFQSRTLEEACLKENIPYQVLGTRFFERKEVKDVLSFVRASLNPESLADIKRIINVPARGIGKVTLLKIVEKKIGELPHNTQSKVNSFFNLLKKIREVALEKKPSETIKFIIEQSGLEQELKKEKNEEGLERLENIQELVSLAQRYDTLENGLEKLLTDAALASDQDELERPKDGVKLMTIHASKGLEFDYVFIVGLEEGLFPHKRFDAGNISTDQAEEERRLFYVALTRARTKLYLSYAQVRTIFGSRQVNIPSEFIFDVSEENSEKEDRDWDAPRKSLLTIDF
ncbi:MAG: hypothetical protein RJA61_164 [Candidatus Parcubacteria bacterium]|jgi:DNA helicase-2/ATP-dependent DNA helicase PcrA